MIRSRLRVLLVGATLALLIAAGAVSASVFTLGPLVQTSGASPFVGACGLAGQTGTVYLDSEVEPWIDVNPANTNNLVGIYQQDRWSNGGARGLVASVSFDGGASWAQSIIPGISLCSGGVYDRATDPWVSFGPTGVVHQLSLSFNDVAPPFEARDFDHSLLASRSTDGGLTWSTPVVVIRDTAPTVFNDKQTITADPTNADFVYAAWDRLVFPGSERASVQASFRTSSFSGPFWFARSTNGGQSWEPARQIYDPGQRDQTIGNQIVVLPNGTLVNIFNEIRNDNKHRRRGGNVTVLRSTDKGVTWSAPIRIDALGTVGVIDPESGDDVRTGDIIPDIAVNRATGTLYAVWQDARFLGGEFDSIAFSQSTDGGLTWSPTIKVNQTPTNVAAANQQAFTPSVHVRADGTVGVTYYDFRSNDAAADLKTEYFIVHCHSSCTNPASWTSENTLTNAPFDMREAPFAVGFFTGDYEGLSSAGNAFMTFFSQPHGGDPSSAFFRTAS
jgi:hypothetical protein